MDANPMSRVYFPSIKYPFLRMMGSLNLHFSWIEIQMWAMQHILYSKNCCKCISLKDHLNC